PAAQQAGSEVGSEQDEEGEPGGRALRMMDDARSGNVASGDLPPEPPAHERLPDGCREGKVALDDRPGLARSGPGVPVFRPHPAAPELSDSVHSKGRDRLPGGGDDTPMPRVPLGHAPK